MARGGTRIETVMAQVQAKIASRAWLPGARLPSVRAQATAMGLSVSTVVEAYERLAAEGAITSRPGSGFYVAGPVAPLALAEIGPKFDREVDPVVGLAPVAGHRARRAQARLRLAAQFVDV